VQRTAIGDTSVAAVASATATLAPSLDYYYNINPCCSNERLQLIIYFFLLNVVNKSQLND